MNGSLRKSGIAPVGDIPWGTHFCHFFETSDDLCDTVVPFFAAGLEQRELCFWLLSDLTPEQCADEWRRRMKHDLDRYVADGALLFQTADEWYRREGVIDVQSMRIAWDRLLLHAQEHDFEGVRVAGCVTWLKEPEWLDFTRCESDFEESVAGKPMIVLCSYPLATTSAAGILDVAHTHDFALAKREGQWDMLEAPVVRLRQLGARNRQRSAVAELGLTAIRDYDLDTLFHHAAKLAAETLGTGRSIVWQLRPEESDMILRAQVGWDELARDSAIPIVEGSAAHYAFTNEEPVTIIDVANDTRFREKSWLLREHGVATLLVSLIRGQDRPWGALSVHSKTRLDLTADDVEFAQLLANVLALAIERHEHERAERREKEMLRTIVDNIPVMIAHTAPTGALLNANPEWKRTLGLQQREIGSDLRLTRVPDNTWRDLQVRAQDGSVLDTMWARFGLSDGSAMTFGVDVSERKRAEEERARLYRSEQRARALAEEALAKLAAIESITDSVLGHMSLDELLAEMLRRLRNVLSTDHAVVFLLDQPRTTLSVRAVEGFPLARASTIRPSIDSPVVGRVIRERRPLIIEHLDPTASAAAEAGLEIRSAMGAPLAAEEKIFGVVMVTSIADRRFTEDELELLRVVADRVGPAIERSRLIENVRSARERLAALSRRLLSVQEEERRRLAIELHDELGQLLTAVKMNLGAQRFEDASENVDLAMQTVRDLALDLRPAMLDDLGLSSALRWYADRVSLQTGVVMHPSIEEVGKVEPGVATVFFRVAQEALTNVVRHARAAHVWIALRHSPTELELWIRDDGAGFDVDAARARAARGASLGLLGMEERVSLAGGFIEIHSAPGEGTEVRVLFSNGGGA